MPNITAILSGLSFVKQVVPIVENVGAEIGPLIQAELADGHALWADVEKAVADLKAAVEKVKAAAATHGA
jgi:hypothetical protein